jgi:hypothetical protein
MVAAPPAIVWLGSSAADAASEGCGAELSAGWVGDSVGRAVGLALAPGASERDGPGVAMRVGNGNVGSGSVGMGRDGNGSVGRGVGAGVGVGVGVGEGFTALTVIVTLASDDEVTPSDTRYVNVRVPTNEPPDVNVNAPFADRLTLPLPPSLTMLAVNVSPSASSSFARTPGAGTMSLTPVVAA